MRITRIRRGSRGRAWRFALLDTWGLAMFVVGVASALLASALFNLGIALQGLEARVTPPSQAMRLSLLRALLRRPRWILGLMLGIVGIAPQALAFETAPFVVVQTALVTGLLLLLFLGVRAFGEDVGPSEVAGVVAIIVGVALVSWGAPHQGAIHRGGIAAVAVVAGLSVPALFPLVLRRSRFGTGMAAIVASGCGFGATNVATKLMSDDVGLRLWTNAVAWASVGLILGVAATVTGMTAFQRRAASTVVPLSTAIQTFLPVLLGPLFLREAWTSAALAGGPLGAGVACALVGSVLVSRTRAVAKLTASAQR